MSDMRYTTLVVTVGDYDSGETLAQIRDQVGRGVRSAGFVSVNVEVQAGQEPGWPLTGVPMVCADCREPVHQVPGIWVAVVWAHDDDARDCPGRVAHLTGTPVMAMVAAGNEDVPRC